MNGDRSHLPPSSRGDPFRIEFIGDGIEAEAGVLQLSDPTDDLNLLRVNREPTVEVCVAVGRDTAGPSLTFCEEASRRTAVRADGKSAFEQSLPNSRFCYPKLIRDAC